MRALRRAPRDPLLYGRLFDAVVDAADRAMYRQKQLGKARAG